MLPSIGDPRDRNVGICELPLHLVQPSSGDELSKDPLVLGVPASGHSQRLAAWLLDAEALEQRDGWYPNPSPQLV